MSAPFDAQSAVVEHETSVGLLPNDHFIGFSDKNPLEYVLIERPLGQGAVRWTPLGWKRFAPAVVFIPPGSSENAV
jgi:hypothetical protein